MHNRVQPRLLERTVPKLVFTPCRPNFMPVNCPTSVGVVSSGTVLQKAIISLTDGKAPWAGHIFVYSNRIWR